MKSFKQVRETSTATSTIIPQWLHKMAMKPKLKDMVKGYLRWRRKNPGQGRGGVQKAIQMMGLSPRDGNLLIDTLNDMVKQGKLPKHLALESCCNDCEDDQPEWGTDDSTKKAKKMTPGQTESKDPNEYDQEGDMAKGQLKTMIDAAQELHDTLQDDENLPEWVQSKITKATDYIDSVRDYLKSQKNESVMPTTAQIRMNRRLKKAGVGKNDDFYNQYRDPAKVKAEKDRQKRPAPMQVKPPEGKTFSWFRTGTVKK